MKNSQLFLFAVIFLAGCSSPSADQGSGSLYKPYHQPNHYISPKVESVIVDGVLEESEWSGASWTDLFQDIQGADLPKPSYDTRAKMVWNNDFLFVAAEISEPHVWATITQRDEVIFYDNDFEVFIDPDGDGHYYYELEVNAFATAWDLLLTMPYRDFGYAIDNWDINGLQVAVSVNGTINDPTDTDIGWTVEMAIPFSVLEECGGFKNSPVSGDFWRINFSRVEWKTEVNEGVYRKQINPATGKPFPEDNWVWSPQYHINMHMPEYWGYLIFSEESSNQDLSWNMPEDEILKWYLRNLYYLESSHFETHKQYTDVLSDLGWPSVAADKPVPEPRIILTPYGYVAALPNTANTGYLTITEKGLLSKRTNFND